jgi:clan AA aspartic protease
MGMIYSKIKLSNPINNGLSVIEANALVDTGSNFLCIPAHIAIQLDLKTLEKREVTIADGSHRTCDYVGPIKVSFENRQCFVGALVLGEQVLLGAIPIEDMDLIIHPAQLKLLVNPQNPNIAGAIVM